MVVSSFFSVVVSSFFSVVVSSFFSVEELFFFAFDKASFTALKIAWELYVAPLTASTPLVPFLETISDGRFLISSLLINCFRFVPFAVEEISTAEIFPFLIVTFAVTLYSLNCSPEQAALPV